MIALIYANIYGLFVFIASVTRIYAGCAIPPDSDGHVTIPRNWSSIDGEAFNIVFPNLPVR